MIYVWKRFMVPVLLDIGLKYYWQRAFSSNNFRTFLKCRQNTEVKIETKTACWNRLKCRPPTVVIGNKRIKEHLIDLIWEISWAILNKYANTSGPLEKNSIDFALLLPFERVINLFPPNCLFQMVSWIFWGHWCVLISKICRVFL